MDSAVCLHRSALHIIPSTTNRAAGLSRPYTIFRPTLSLFSSSKAFTYTLPLHSFTSSPVRCAINKQPSPASPNFDKDNGNRIVRVVGGASIVLACVLGVINCNFNFSPTAIAGPSFSESTQKGGFPAVVNHPKDVLYSMLMVNNILAGPQQTWYERHWKSPPKLYIPERPENEHRKKLKDDVADLIKAGMCKEAEQQLIALYDDCSKKGWSEPANAVEMELVLVLIFQGDYDKALERKCLSADSAVSSDGRVHFYKAIVHTMLGHEEAKDCWIKFVGSFGSLPSEKFEVPTPKTQRIKT